jgi:Flp pilus assembly protein TadB
MTSSIDKVTKWVVSEEKTLQQKLFSTDLKNQLQKLENEVPEDVKNKATQYVPLAVDKLRSVVDQKSQIDKHNNLRKDLFITAMVFTAVAVLFFGLSFAFFAMPMLIVAAIFGGAALLIGAAITQQNSKSNQAIQKLAKFLFPELNNISHPDTPPTVEHTLAAQSKP